LYAHPGSDSGFLLELHGPLQVGDEITRRSRIAHVDAKQGRSGRLVFVTVRRALRGGCG